MKIYLATGNRHKLEEFRLMFPEHEIVLPEDEGIAFSFEETGKTYFENSCGKAETLYKIVRAPVLADDSGLSVDALDGAPGIYSARYGFEAGLSPSPAEQMDRLLKSMEQADDRKAAFVCCLTLITGPLRFFTVQETLTGSIAREKNGSGGFGYDPIFLPDGSSRTLACYTPEEKAAISHRGKAAAAMRRLLTDADKGVLYE